MAASFLTEVFAGVLAFDLDLDENIATTNACAKAQEYFWVRQESGSGRSEHDSMTEMLEKKATKRTKRKLRGTEENPWKREKKERRER